MCGLQTTVVLYKRVCVPISGITTSFVMILHMFISCMHPSELCSKKMDYYRSSKNGLNCGVCECM